MSWLFLVPGIAGLIYIVELLNTDTKGADPSVHIMVRNVRIMEVSTRRGSTVF